MRQRPRKAIRVVEIPGIDFAEVTHSDALPVRAVTLSVDGNKRGIAFTISKAARDAFDDVAFKALAQTLGNLVHPFPCTLVVLPNSDDLRAYEVSGV